MPGAIVIAGPARCGKTERLLTSFRQVLTQQPPGSALWLSPNHRAAAAIRQQALRGNLAGCLSPNVLTFDQFARRLLEAADRRIRPISSLVQRQILRDLVDKALADEKLAYFAPIASSAGFLDLLVHYVRQLKRLEIWPEELAAAHGARV